MAENVTVKQTTSLQQSVVFSVALEGVDVSPSDSWAIL
jgi:hypothetical protein